MDFFRDLTVRTVEDSVFIDFGMPGGNIDVAQILQQNGITNARTVYVNAEGPPQGTNFSYIRGKTTISNVPAGVQARLSVNNFPVKGVAYKDSANPNTYVVNADSGVFKLKTATDKVAITNGDISYDASENIVGNDGYIEFADTTINDVTLANAIQPKLSIYPNNPATLAQAPYVKSFALPYLVGGDKSAYPLTNGDWCTFVQDGTSISRFTFDGEGGLLAKDVVFDYRNTGPNLDANQVPSTGIPLNGTLPADGEMTITGFATEALPDGSVALATTYNRHKGPDYLEAETAGVVFVYDSNGTAIAGTREIKYFDDISSQAFNRQLLTIGTRGLAPDNEGFFIAFAKGGHLETSGLFINGTDPQDITAQPSANFPSLTTPPRQQLSPQEFSEIAFDGSNLVVNSLYDPNHKLTQIGNTVTHLISAGESYVAGTQCLIDGNPAPQNIILSAEAANATITFSPNCDYTVTGQCNNTSFVFPQLVAGQNITLIESGVGVNVSTAVHLPNNINITFVGEDASCIMSNVVQQLQTTTVTSTVTATSTSQTETRPTSAPIEASSSEASSSQASSQATPEITTTVTTIPSFSSSSLTASSTLGATSTSTSASPYTPPYISSSSSTSTTNPSLLTSLATIVTTTLGSSATTPYISSSPATSSIAPALNVTMTPLLPNITTTAALNNNTDTNTTAIVPYHEKKGLADSTIIEIAIPSAAGMIFFGFAGYHYRKSIANVGIRARNLVMGLFGADPIPLYSTEKEWKFPRLPRRGGSRITPEEGLDLARYTVREQEDGQLQVDQIREGTPSAHTVVDFEEQDRSQSSAAPSRRVSERRKSSSHRIIEVQPAPTAQPVKRKSGGEQEDSDIEAAEADHSDHAEGRSAKSSKSAKMTSPTDPKPESSRPSTTTRRASARPSSTRESGATRGGSSRSSKSRGSSQASFIITPPTQ